VRKDLYCPHLSGGYGNAGMRPERRSAAGMKGGVQPPSAPILAESGKSREREGSALALSELRFLRAVALF
jgi:hypothetical protein